MKFAIVALLGLVSIQAISLQQTHCIEQPDRGVSNGLSQIMNKNKSGDGYVDDAELAALIKARVKYLEVASIG